MTYYALNAMLNTGHSFTHWTKKQSENGKINSITEMNQNPGCEI